MYDLGQGDSSEDQNAYLAFTESQVYSLAPPGLLRTAECRQSAPGTAEEASSKLEDIQ